jgi:hypothetical protein
MTKLRFTDFIELVLARLYEADREGGHEHFVEMDEVASGLKEDIPEAWPFDALVELENRGLIQAMKVMGSNGLAKINGAGRLYVEEQERESESVIHDYRKHPSNFVVVTGRGHQVAVGTSGDVAQTSVSKETRNEVVVLLDEMEARLREDDSLTDAAKGMALEDVQASRKQLDRPEPNKRAVAALLEPLAHIASISSSVAKIIALLGG